ncbi:signal recognition particle subunit srp68 [Quaeritorhiza haematococci]|nr:signal recognition particle subunit srp68 [Quaeritorhiza haematococci]
MEMDEEFPQNLRRNGAWNEEWKGNVISVRGKDQPQVMTAETPTKEETTTVSSPDVPAGPLSLDVLATVNDARNMHGLRHQDYQRYRQFCARKIHRVRKAANLVQGKKKFEKKDVTIENAETIKHLEIPLFQAERAWSYAMQLKRESASEPRKRHHLMKRLKKAAEAAAKLEQICQEGKVDTRTALDVQAYAALMAGYVLFEKQSWQEALDKFAAARTIYEKLASAGTAQQEALCYSAMDTIDPNIRYCAYNLKLSKGQVADISALIEMRNKSAAADGGAGLDLLASKVESLLAQTRQERAATVQNISWRGRTVAIKNERLVDAVLSAQEAMQNLDELKKKVGDGVDLEGDSDAEDDAAGKKKGGEQKAAKDKKAKKTKKDELLEAYDTVLGALWDASRIAEADVKEDAIATAKVKSSKSEANTAALQLAHGYVVFTRLSRTVERNLLLVDILKRGIGKVGAGSVATGDGKKAPRMEDVVRLYDTVLQSFNEMRDLPAFQNDLPLQSLITAKTYLYKAQRAYHIGLVYSSASKHLEALALFDRSLEHLTRLHAEVASALSTSTTSASSKKKKQEDASSPTSQSLCKEDEEELKDVDEAATVFANSVVRGAKVCEQARWCLEEEEVKKGGKGTKGEVEKITEKMGKMKVGEGWVPPQGVVEVSTCVRRVLPFVVGLFSVCFEPGEYVTN